MLKDIIYNTNNYQLKIYQHIKIFIEEDRHLMIEVRNNCDVTVYHYMIIDEDDYEDFKFEITSVIKDCKDFEEIEHELRSYLKSEYIYDFLEDRPECVTKYIINRKEK